MRAGGAGRIMVARSNAELARVLRGDVADGEVKTYEEMDRVGADRRVVVDRSGSGERPAGGRARTPARFPVQSRAPRPRPLALVPEEVGGERVLGGAAGHDVGEQETR